MKPDIVKLDPPRTYEEWLADVRKASGDPECYVLGTGTGVFLDDGAVFVVGLIGSFRTGTLQPDGTMVSCAEHLQDQWKSGDHRKVIGYVDDPYETVRDEWGAAKEAPEAKAESDYDCGVQGAPK